MTEQERAQSAAAEAEEALRDLMALGELVAMGTWTPQSEPGQGFSAEERHRRRAESAYSQADAMMEARKRRPAP